MGPANSMTWLLDLASDNVVLPVHAACENNSDVNKQTDNARSCAKHCATHVAMTSSEQDYLPLNSRGKVHTNTKTVSVSLSHKIVLPPPKTV